MNASSPSPEPTVLGAARERRPGAEVLAGAIRGDGVFAEFQPIVDLARARVAGYEALVRFEGPAPSPLPWFELARVHGRLVELEAAALRCALGSLADLPAHTFLTVNMSPTAIDAPAVQAVWRDFPSLSGVVIELTEHERIDSYTRLEPTLDRLRGAGALLAIDDAGAGYAGLQHILTLRPDVIKLDRGLVKGLDRDEAKRALLEMIGTLAGHLDAWLLAEGIETADELDVLVGMGVPLAQGFFLGRPGPGFPRMEPAAANQILRQSLQQGDSGLRPLLEFVPVAHDYDGAVAALADERVDLVVLLDDRQRPQGTLDVDGIMHALRDSGLRMKVATEPVDAIQRALVRVPRHRFAPLVCTDDAGRYMGIVRMERLVALLCRRDRAGGVGDGA